MDLPWDQVLCEGYDTVYSWTAASKLITDVLHAQLVSSLRQKKKTTALNSPRSGLEMAGSIRCHKESPTKSKAGRAAGSVRRIAMSD